MITVGGFGSEYGQLDAGQPELAATMILLLCLGFVLMGFTWLLRGTIPVSHQRIPALTVGVLGVAGIIGGLVVFQSWAHRGLAGGLRGLLLLVFVLVGAGCGLAGWRWYQKRELRWPLAIQSGGLALGLFYLIHQQLDLLIDVPILVLLVFLVVVLPAIGVLRWLQPKTVFH